MSNIITTAAGVESIYDLVFVSHYGEWGDFSEVVEGSLWDDNTFREGCCYGAAAKLHVKILKELPKGSYNNFKEKGILPLGIAFPTEKASHLAKVFPLQGKGRYKRLLAELQTIRSLLRMNHSMEAFYGGSCLIEETKLSLEEREKALIEDLHKIFS